MGAKGTCQQLTSQQNPLPVCTLSEEPYPLDRDRGKSFLPREKEVMAELLGCCL